MPHQHNKRVARPTTYVRSAVQCIVSALILCVAIACTHGEAPGHRRETLSSSYNALAFTLMSQLSQTNEDRNVLICPIAVATALTMLHDGAAGNSAAEIATVLHLPNASSETIDSLASNLVETLTHTHQRDSQSISNAQFDVANSVWLQKQFSIRSQFTDDCQKFFSAEITNVDFGQNATLSSINNWVTHATRGKIPEMLSELPPESTAMMLLSTAYFQAEWQSQFAAEGTSEGPFRTESGRTVPSHYMHQVMDSLAYVHEPNFQAFKLPYDGGQFALYVLLPDPKSTVQSIVDQMTAERWSALLQKLQPKEFRLAFPKLNITGDLSMITPLKALGLHTVFDRNKANLHRISRNKVFVDDFRQKISLTAEEKGTEAAAAVLVRGGVEYGPAHWIPDFINVNHPFFLAIAEQQTGVILFCGKISAPEM